MAEKVFLWKDAAPYTDCSPDGFQPFLTCYPVPAGKGAVIVMAGGAYLFKSDYEAFPVAEKLRDAGIGSFVLDYRVSPCHKLAPLSDANRAVRLVRSLGYEKVAVLGFSAGGNLCCSAAVHWDGGNPESEDPIERFSSRPDGFIPCYAVSSMVSYTHGGTVKALLGDDSDNLSDKRYFSAELNVTRDTPPAFLWHTVTDSLVPVESTLNLAKALSDCGIPYEMHIFPCGDHGLGLAQDNPTVAQWMPLLQKWLINGGYGV